MNTKIKSEYDAMRALADNPKARYEAATSNGRFLECGNCGQRRNGNCKCPQHRSK